MKKFLLITFTISFACISIVQFQLIKSQNNLINDLYHRIEIKQTHYNTVKNNYAKMLEYYESK